MKIISRLFLIALAAAFVASCSKSEDPGTASSVSLTLSSGSNVKSSMAGARVAVAGDSVPGDTIPLPSGISFSDVVVNIRDIKFDFKNQPGNQLQDSTYGDNDSKLKGPFLVNLMNSGSFVDQVVTTVNLPNATYERVRFKLVPSKAGGNMYGKSIRITGNIGATPFVFWHDRDAKFGAKIFNDSTSTDSTTVSPSTGQVLNLAISLELNKIFGTLDGKVDLTKAKDKNNDGVISIDPNNTDGNKWLADRIMALLAYHVRCEKKHNK